MTDAAHPGDAGTGHADTPGGTEKPSPDAVLGRTADEPAAVGPVTAENGVARADAEAGSVDGAGVGPHRAWDALAPKDANYLLGFIALDILRASHKLDRDAAMSAIKEAYGLMPERDRRRHTRDVAESLVAYVQTGTFRRGLHGGSSSAPSSDQPGHGSSAHAGPSQPRGSTSRDGAQAGIFHAGQHGGRPRHGIRSDSDVSAQLGSGEFDGDRLDDDVQQLALLGMEWAASGDATPTVGDPSARSAGGVGRHLADQLARVPVAESPDVSDLQPNIHDASEASVDIVVEPPSRPSSILSPRSQMSGSRASDSDESEPGSPATSSEEVASSDSGGGSQPVSPFTADVFDDWQFNPGSPTSLSSGSAESPTSAVSSVGAVETWPQQNAVGHPHDAASVRSRGADRRAVDSGDDGVSGTESVASPGDVSLPPVEESVLAASPASSVEPVHFQWPPATAQQSGVQAVVGAGPSGSGVGPGALSIPGVQGQGSGERGGADDVDDGVLPSPTPTVVAGRAAPRAGSGRALPVRPDGTAGSVPDASRYLGPPAESGVQAVVGAGPSGSGGGLGRCRFRGFRGRVPVGAVGPIAAGGGRALPVRPDGTRRVPDASRYLGPPAESVCRRWWVRGPRGRGWGLGRCRFRGFRGRVPVSAVGPMTSMMVCCRRRRRRWWRVGPLRGRGRVGRCRCDRMARRAVFPMPVAIWGPRRSLVCRRWWVRGPRGRGWGLGRCRFRGFRGRVPVSAVGPMTSMMVCCRRRRRRWWRVGPLRGRGRVGRCRCDRMARRAVFPMPVAIWGPRRSLVCRRWWVRGPRGRGWGLGRCRFRGFRGRVPVSAVGPMTSMMVCCRRRRRRWWRVGPLRGRGRVGRCRCDRMARRAVFPMPVAIWGPRRSLVCRRWWVRGPRGRGWGLGRCRFRGFRGRVPVSAVGPMTSMMVCCRRRRRRWWRVGPLRGRGRVGRCRCDRMARRAVFPMPVAIWGPRRSLVCRRWWVRGPRGRGWGLGRCRFRGFRGRVPVSAVGPMTSMMVWARTARRAVRVRWWGMALANPRRAL